MKFLTILVLFLALLANSLALKDAMCGDEFSKIGIGRAFFVRWSYNQNTNSCEEFVFGGIGGNNNSFESEQECISKCVETESD
ncbi:hypothetical protein KR093_002358 [Drosophila rubida]|uniref:BPTI/Kunitz inhibitor domain-containing protein n=1 Tax=Drosophila rubida TaxID=30044 RepID=A0AAD4K6C3_9MUSC|nr:hypothetical protein KR093_002358 [Drosophila rubida]